MWWLVYVRWNSGKRETIRTQTPAHLVACANLWVVACLPEPEVSVWPKP